MKNTHGGAGRGQGRKPSAATAAKTELALIQVKAMGQMQDALNAEFDNALVKLRERINGVEVAKNENVTGYPPDVAAIKLVIDRCMGKVPERDVLLPKQEGEAVDPVAMLDAVMKKFAIEVLTIIRSGALDPVPPMQAALAQITEIAVTEVAAE